MCPCLQLDSKEEKEEEEEGRGRTVEESSTRILLGAGGRSPCRMVRTCLPTTVPLRGQDSLARRFPERAQQPTQTAARTECLPSRNWGTLEVS